MNNKNDDRYVNYLSEKVYSSNSIDEYEIRSFFDELVYRKREDPVEGGLQASMLILANKFAAKVNEKDGTGLHLCEFVNLVKFLNDDHTYFIDKAMRFPMLYSEQLDVIMQEGIEVRILDGDKSLIISISSFKMINDYQKEVLKKLLLVCREKLDNYQNIEIGINTPNVLLESTNLDIDNYESINSIIDGKNVKRKR